MSLKRIRKILLDTRREILGLVNDGQDYRRQPQNTFTLQGYETIQGFLDKAECDRLIQVTNRYLHSHSYSINGNSYLVSRRDLKVQNADMEVQQIFNAQEVDENLSQLFHSRVLQDMFESRIGERMKLLSITIKIDDLDVRSKRGYHTDGVTPPSYKAFIYLNDVDEYGDGPYTLIPNSHRHTFRRIINYLYAQVTTSRRRTTYNRKEDIRFFYSDQQAVSIFGKAGTLILSNQQLAHKGWHQHDRNRRYALVCYLQTEKHNRGQRFNLYRYAAKTRNTLAQVQE